MTVAGTSRLVQGGLAVLLVGAACRTASDFSRVLPAGVPDPSRWEHSSGRAEFENPHRLIAYELYVQPGREALYALTRYRITLTDPQDRERYGITANEKLQWDPPDGAPRRFECDAPRSGACQWRELPRWTSEYIGETSSILSIYSLHLRLLHRQAAQEGSATP
jgi:hypothetical protein